MPLRLSLRLSLFHPLTYTYSLSLSPLHPPPLPPLSFSCLSDSVFLDISLYLILSLCFCHGLSFSLTPTSFDHVNLWLTGFSVTCCPIVTWPPLIRKYHQCTAAGLSLNECSHGTVLYGKPFHADMLPCWAYYATTVATI